LHLYVYFPNRMATCYISLRPMRVLILFIQFSSSPSVPAALTPATVQQKAGGLQTWSGHFEEKIYCPLPDVETRTVTVPTELSRLHISSLLVKIFPSLRLSQTSVNTCKTLTTQMLSLHCVHIPCAHSTDVMSSSCRTRQSVSQLPVLAVLIPPGTYTLTRTLCTSLLQRLVQCSSGETTGKQHLATTLSRLGLPADWRPRETEVTS